MHKTFRKMFGKNGFACFAVMLFACLLSFTESAWARNAFGENAAPAKVRITTGEFSVIDEATRESLFAFDSMEIGNLDMATLESEDIPRAMSFSIRGLRFNPKHQMNYANSNEYKKAMFELTRLDKTVREMGYPNGIHGMKLDFDIDYAFSPEEKRFSLNKAGIGVSTVGSLEFGFRLGGTDEKFVQNIGRAKDFGGIMQALSTLTVEEVTLRYRDDSFFDRFLKNEGLPLGKDVQEMRREATNNVMTKLASTNSIFTQNIGKSLMSFLQGNTNEIMVVVNPDKPVPLLAFPAYLKSLAR